MAHHWQWLDNHTRGIKSTTGSLCFHIPHSTNRRSYSEAATRFGCSSGLQNENHKHLECLPQTIRLIRLRVQWVVFSQVPGQQMSPHRGLNPFTNGRLPQNQGICQKLFYWLAFWFIAHQFVLKIKPCSSLWMCCKTRLITMWLLTMLKEQ